MFATVEESKDARANVDWMVKEPRRIYLELI